MAKFTSHVFAEIRGSVNGIVYTRNPYGAIVRNRTKPTVSTSEHATNAKARFTTATQAWQNLTAAQREAWRQWANANPIQGSLGDPQILTGHVAFVGIQCRRIVSGDAMLTDPPVTPAPSSLASCSVVADKTAGTLNFTYTDTPLGATEKLWFQACQVASSGVVYVQNLLKYCGNSAAAQASPNDSIVRVELRIGALVIGYEFFALVSVYDNVTGLLSVPLRCTDTIV